MKTVTYDETKWRVVPVEPTREMLIAINWPDDKTGYAAMLSAAPQPEQVESEPVAHAVLEGRDIADSGWGFIAPWPEACHEHINDAINEFGEGKDWRVVPLYTSPPPDHRDERIKELEELVSTREDDIRVEQMWVQKHSDRIAALESALDVAKEALTDCEGALDECRDYPVTYDSVIEALRTIEEARKK